jgi:hypothetical protein
MADLEHMDTKVRKAHNLLWACGVKWGLRPRVVHCLYISIVRPSNTLASLVWWPGCQMARTKKKLSRVQTLACLGITGVMHITPINGVKTLVCLPPTRISGTVYDEVSCTTSQEAGKLVLTTSQSRT